MSQAFFHSLNRSFETVFPGENGVISYNPANVSPRNNFSGIVGFQFTVGASNIQITHIGRAVLSGNNQAHTISVYNADGTTVIGGGSINTLGETPDTFVWAAITPFTLTAGTTYFLMTTEVAAADAFADYISVVGDSYITVQGASFSVGAPIENVAPGTTTSYSLPNFKYTL